MRAAVQDFRRTDIADRRPCIGRAHRRRGIGTVTLAIARPAAAIADVPTTAAITTIAPAVSTIMAAIVTIVATIAVIVPVISITVTTPAARRILCAAGAARIALRPSVCR